MIKNIRALVVIGAMVLFPMSVFAEDVPMTEEEVCFEEDYAIEAQTEEEVLIVAEEDEFLEEDGLIAAEDDEEPIYVDEDTFPDKNFRDFVQENYCDHFGKYFWLKDPSSVPEINVSSKNIGDLKGIENFTKLKKLNCERNNLASLDVKGLTALEELNCSNNEIANLYVSGCTALKKLFCYGNLPLTNLNVTGCTALEVLYCG